MKHKTALKNSPGDSVFYGISNTALVLVLLLVAIPMLNIIASSLSSTAAVITGRVFVWPVEFSLDGYKAVLRESDVITGYMNTILYAVVGTIVNLIVTVLAAYPLSRKDLPGKRALTFLFTFTMMFNGGMIPTYLLIKNLGLINNRLVMILPTALSVYNMIVVTTHFRTALPGELLESAQIDGCSDFKFLWSIAIPLSKSVLSVVALFYAVGHWNAFFDAMLYLKDKAKYPLAIVLRDILVNSKFSSEVTSYEAMVASGQGSQEVLKYALIVISSLPLWCAYPFLQKSFVNGVMLGSLKG